MVIPRAGAGLKTNPYHEKAKCYVGGGEWEGDAEFKMSKKC
jgi:hypothetical protein